MTKSLARWALACVCAFASFPAAADQFDQTLITAVPDNDKRDFLFKYADPVGYIIGGCSGALIGPDLFMTAGHCDIQIGQTVRFRHRPDYQPCIPMPFPFQPQCFNWSLDASIVSAIRREDPGGSWTDFIDFRVLGLGPLRWAEDATPVTDGNGDPVLPGDHLGYLRFQAWKHSLGTDVCMSGHFDGEWMHSSCGDIVEGGVFPGFDCDYDDACRHSTMESYPGVSGASWINSQGFIIGINRGRYLVDEFSVPFCWGDGQAHAGDCYASGTNAHNAMRQASVIQDAIALDAPEVMLGTIPIWLTAPYRHWIFYREDISDHTIMMGRKHSLQNDTVVNYPFYQRDATHLNSTNLPEMRQGRRSASWENDSPELGHVAYTNLSDDLTHAWGGSGASWDWEDLSGHIDAVRDSLSITALWSTDVTGWVSSNGIQHILTVAQSPHHLDRRLIHLWYDNNTWSSESIGGWHSYVDGSLTSWQSTGSGGGPIQHIAYIDDAQRLRHIYHSNGSWHGPVTVGVLDIVADDHADLTAVNSSGNQHLVYIDRWRDVKVYTWDSNASVWNLRDVSDLTGAPSAAMRSGSFQLRLSAWSAQHYPLAYPHRHRTLTIAYMTSGSDIEMIWWDPTNEIFQNLQMVEGTTRNLRDGTFYDERPRTMLSSARFDNLGFVGRNGHVYYVVRDDSGGTTGQGVPFETIEGSRWLRYNLSSRTGMPAGWEYDPLLGRQSPF